MKGDRQLAYGTRNIKWPIVLLTGYSLGNVNSNFHETKETPKTGFISYLPESRHTQNHTCCDPSIPRLLGFLWAQPSKKKGHRLLENTSPWQFTKKKLADFPIPCVCGPETYRESLLERKPGGLWEASIYWVSGFQLTNAKHVYGNQKESSVLLALTDTRVHS